MADYNLAEMTRDDLMSERGHQEAQLRVAIGRRIDLERELSTTVQEIDALNELHADIGAEVENRDATGALYRAGMDTARSLLASIKANLSATAPSRVMTDWDREHTKGM